MPGATTASDVLFAPAMAVKLRMVQGFAACAGRVDEDAEVLARRLLADELVEALRPKGGIRILGGALGRGQAGGVGGHCFTCGNLHGSAQLATLSLKQGEAFHVDRPADDDGG